MRLVANRVVGPYVSDIDVVRVTNLHLLHVSAY
jgi:hypothetical protein